MTQAQALDILKMGRNVFITGPAGSGKTYVVNQYIKYLRDHDVSIGITASTGIAATHMGGVTIHSWSGMGIKNDLSDHDLAALADDPKVSRRIREAATLIIDEVSMLHHFRLDTLNDITKHIRKNQEPFGGLQIVLCGDFFQLPPVSKFGEPDTHFIYRSEAWRDGGFTVCYLHENFRQGDDPILNILNEIRSGEVSDGSREKLRGRHKNIVRNEISEPPSEATRHNTLERSLQASPRRDDSASDSVVRAESIVGEEIVISYDVLQEIEPTKLYTHNADVDVINNGELKKIHGVEVTYEMLSKGRKPLVEALKKSCLAPEQLRLKKGARVMCVKNNFDKGYVNGTLGVVVSCGHGVDPIIRTAGTPDCPEGRLVTIEPATWSIDDDGKILAEIAQYPLRLAWAITVHKSQGMSLDAVEVDLRRAFEPGMGYVALSRVRTLAGLSIVGMNEHALSVHTDVLEYDRHLRDLSARAERVMEATDRQEVQTAQETFLARVAPLHTRGTRRKVKAKKLDTYTQTALLIRDQMPLAEMIKARGMVAETIVNHIEELIIRGPERGGVTLADIAYLKKDISPLHFMKIDQALEEVSIADDKRRERTEDPYRPPLLSPVKRKVGANISFREIQLVRVLQGYIKRRPD